MSVKLQILGTGCPKCHKLQDATEQAARELSLSYEVEKVTDPNQIVDMGVMLTPALVVDGVVRVMGKVPSVQQLKDILTKA